MKVLLIVFLLLLPTARAGEEDQSARTVRAFNFRAVRLAITDLTQTFGSKYPKGPEYLKRLDALEKSVKQANLPATELARQMSQLRSEALLSNPLLDFDRMFVVKRAYRTPAPAKPPSRIALPRLYTNYGPGLGLPVNHYSMFSVEPSGYDNEIAQLSLKGGLTTFFRPKNKEYVGYVELHHDAGRLLFTMPRDGRYQVFEIHADGSGLRQVTASDQPDVDNYDGTYLPDGHVIFCSTAGYESVPCWNGLQNTAGLYSMKAEGGPLRQLTVDQDDDSYPTVLNTGQVLYNRWQYTNTPHVFGHMLVQMNPDGTGMREYYGSNSYWPNSVYFARAIPGEAAKVVGVVSGHHGDSRMGELVVIDPSKGRREVEGIVQRIPGYGQKVEPAIRDQLVSESWPKFMNPYPLSDKYFLVSAKTSPDSNWGIYLVDIFDNMLLIREERDYALLEPVPIRKTPRPPVIPERIDATRKDAVVYLHDVYAGPGLAGVPHDAVKSLRVFSYHFAYRGVGGWDKVGIDGPWDVMRILGTVPVESDGSAMFHVPAYTPISVQPLDEKGRALQLMRSWFTAMPGEVRSCVGCHEAQNSVPNLQRAAVRTPAEIQPWYGPARGFDFEREVQPVLDKYCVGCHKNYRASKYFPDYKGQPTNVPEWWSGKNPMDWAAGLMRSSARKPMYIKFTPAYEALHPYVRRPGLEGDYHLPNPGEYHASTSELVQMLEKGHHNVQLDKEAWDRLITWIDLDVPCHGTWGQILPVPFNGVNRRRELLKLYTGFDDDPESVPAITRAAVEPVMPAPAHRPSPVANCPGWPFDIQEARERQRAAGFPIERTVAGMKFVLVPAGEFIMGDPDGAPDEAPKRVRIDQPFWMSATEVTNEQYGRFDAAHDSGYINQLNTNNVARGYPVNEPEQPVVRVSWKEAGDYCHWLSGKTGEHASLPTEAQWEWACRAGTSTPLYFGYTNTNFGKWANMADATLTKFAEDARVRGALYAMQVDWMLKIPEVKDGALVTTRVGSYYANAWGLFDMHGNAAEWTAEQSARGGSWADRPQRCRSASRVQYPAWQRVYDVGFRVVLPLAAAR